VPDKEVNYMPIKPVDFQVMIPRTLDAAKMQSDEMQKHVNIAQQQAAAFQNKAEDTVRQVYSRSRTEEARISEKQKEDNRQRNSKKREENKRGGSDSFNGRKKSTSEIRTSTIDIKI